MEFKSLPAGRSVESQTIEVFKSKVKNSSSKVIYLLSSVHGDEVEGAYLLKKLFEWLQLDSTSLDIPFIVIPVLNMDGYRHNTRVNSHGVDLNRNFPSKEWTDVALEKKYFPGTSPLSEPENIFLNNLFLTFQPGLIISFHSWKPIINYNAKCKDIAELIHSYNKYPIDPILEGHPTPGSLGEYAPEKFNCPVLTFECPLLKKDLTLNDIWLENESAFKNLLMSEIILNYLK